LQFKSQQPNIAGLNKIHAGRWRRQLNKIYVDFNFIELYKSKEQFNFIK